MKLEYKLFSVALVLLVAVAIIHNIGDDVDIVKESKLPRFSSDKELLDALEDARGRGLYVDSMVKGGVMQTAMAESAPSASRDFSTTNIQVEGVDEADIVKTDGSYIYAVTNTKLIIAKAYPANEAKILASIELEEYYPQEMFIDEDRLLLFGTADYDYYTEPAVGTPVKEMIYPRYVGLTSVRLYDTSDKTDPELLRTVDFEGSYLTSRKIGDDVYFVVNSYPHYYPEPRSLCEDILPLYKDSKRSSKMEPISRCIDVGYIPPIQAQNFITVVAMSMIDEDGEVQKEVIVGSGQNIYASLDNLYIAQTTWPRYDEVGELVKDYSEKTVVTKFELNDGAIDFIGTGEVKGYILNQFSMDEYDNHFRIATTRGEVWDERKKSTNNVYVLDKELEVVGELEDLAPGERIYSVRFMGERGYVVTFKKVDPLFVIDLSDPEKPDVLGKLKIPGYSDYLHPYDEDHIIGIGKDTVEAEEGLKEGRNLDFAWYQGMKIAIFDVSDVENPIEMHKVVIGDRGTDSPVLRDHKAFLFDRERDLLVIPITLAEIKGERTSDNQYGEFTFQGAYVYDVTLDDGFELRGRITHYDNDDVFRKSGFYFSGDAEIKRSLFIEDVLYTLSDKRIQLNDLDSLEKLKELVLNGG